MSWYAVENLQKAADETKELLLPFDKSIWIRLTVIIIFTGQGVNIPSGGLPSGDTGIENSAGPSNPAYTDFSNSATLDIQDGKGFEDLMTGIGTAGLAYGFGGFTVALVLGILTLFFLLFLVSSIFEFIFYQSLIDKKVRIRRNFRKHFNKGLRYFGFRTVILVILISSIGIPVFVFGLEEILGILFLLPWLVFLFVGMIFLGLTNNFVVPRMIERGEGVLEAWRSFYPDLKNQWKQVAFYVIARFFIKMVIGVLTLLFVVASFLILLIPFGIMGIAINAIASWLVAVPVILGILTFVALMILFRIPLETYLYYYALLVYHDLTE